MAGKNLIDATDGDATAVGFAGQIETSQLSWAKQCGVCHVGGGQLEYDRDMMPYGQPGTTNEGDRYLWMPSHVSGTTVVTGSLVQITGTSGYEDTELYGSNSAEVDCMMCHMTTAKAGAAWYLNSGLCGMGYGPKGDPNCGGAFFTFTPGTIYDSFNRNMAINNGWFDIAATAGIGATVNSANGAVSNVPLTIPGNSVAAVPSSTNCAQCHARVENNVIGLPGMAAMTTGFGNYFRTTFPGQGFDADEVAGTGANCGTNDCKNNTTWFEFGCKTGMGKRSQRAGTGSSHNWGSSGMCAACDYMSDVLGMNLWTNPNSICANPALQGACSMMAGVADVKAAGMQVPVGSPIAGKVIDRDVHDGVGLKCGTCHYTIEATGTNPIPAKTISAVIQTATGPVTKTYTYPANTDIRKIDHQIAQGYSMLEKANDNLDGTVTCAGCHITKEHPNTGKAPNPALAHAGFPASHFEKIDCRTCHIPSVYSSPGRLKYRDWSAGTFRGGVRGSNGNANHLDWNFNMLTGSHDPMAMPHAWISTPEGTKIAPILPSLLPVWTGMAKRASDSFTLGWAPAKTRDVSGAAIVVKNNLGTFNLNGVSELPLFDGFQLADVLKIDTQAEINAMAAELGTPTGTGYASHGNYANARLNLFPTMFDPSHGVVPKAYAIGGSATGGCVACHSSSDPASPNYNANSVGFFDKNFEMLKDPLSQLADYDCDTMCAMFGDCADPAHPTCRAFVGGQLMPGLGLSMDGVDFIQMMAVKEGATQDADGCNPMMAMFTGDPMSTGCGAGQTLTRAEALARFKIALQQDTFTVAGGTNWNNPITGAYEAVPGTLKRVFGIVAVGKNPGNASHANKFDMGATCVTDPMTGATGPCTAGGYINTKINANQLLGYDAATLASLQVPISNPTPQVVPVAKFSLMVSQTTDRRVDFNATPSIPSPAASYAWSFVGATCTPAEGTTLTSAVVKCNFDVKGAITATLTVANSSGATNTTSKTVYAIEKNVAPTATIGSSVNTTTNEATLTLTGGSTDIVKVSIDWNDGSGTMDTDGTYGPYTHVYGSEATYYASVTLVDNLGLRTTYKVALTTK